MAALCGPWDSYWVKSSESGLEASTSPQQHNTTSEEGMEIDCQPEESIVSSFDEDCVVLGDVKDMRLEAEAVVNDVLFAVSEMHVSQSLNSASDVAYINVETREGNRYCLELTEAGLRVVGYAFDQVNEDLSTQYHETVYSLLDTLSPGYREAFGNALLQRLERLKQNGQ
ncbi:GSK3-beta interaction protein [Larimichthys crocea]|uniref:GSK3-beta interaction protein n=2 Tax=Larimichthys crocea TaxID=215358 RepID=A0A6G0IF81_LARCR|nr:GSK3-beta interaction protein [Larimichthys crocea]